MGAGHNPSFNHRRLRHAHQGIVVKVGLLNHTVLNVNLSKQGSCQCKVDRAFNLLRYGARIDHRTAIDGAHHTVHMGLAVLHRNFGHLRHDRAKGFVQGHTMRMT